MNVINSIQFNRKRNSIENDAGFHAVCREGRPSITTIDQSITTPSPSTPVRPKLRLVPALGGRSLLEPLAEGVHHERALVGPVQLLEPVVGSGGVSMSADEPTQTITQLALADPSVHTKKVLTAPRS